MATTPTDASLTMGHIALHYATPADGPLAARLLGFMGLLESQMLPLPGGNFYRFVVSPDHMARGDGIVFLSCLPDPQARLIAAIRSALHVGATDEHQAVKDYRAMMAQDFEASFHFGFLAASLEALEGMVATLQADTPLANRVTIGVNRARRGDEAIDALLDESPLFGTATRYAYGSGGVQVFVETDLVCAGQLGESMVFEFDYVFPDRTSHILSIVEL